MASSTPGRAFSNPILAILRVIALVFVTTTLLIGWLIVRAMTLDPKERAYKSAIWTNRWFRSLRWLLGWRVHVEGEIPKGGHLLAPNHIGYCDVLALGCVMPCHFVAKADVLGWPVVGYLFSVSGHIGVARKRDISMRATIDAVTEKLKLDAPVVVFLEGTSTGGDRVLPFRAPLIQPAVEANVPVVPIALNYRSDNPAIDISDDIAYWKDHVFAVHVWRLCGLSAIDVTAKFGDPVYIEEGGRKKAAKQLRQAVSDLGGYPMIDERGGGYASPFD